MKFAFIYHLLWMWIQPLNYTIVIISFVFSSINYQRKLVSLMLPVFKFRFHFKMINQWKHLPIVFLFYNFKYINIFNLFPFQGKVYLAYVFFHKKSNKALFI